ncbi:MAG: hypothetical protein OER21_16220 [Gemmatimonadota bacterium]|nr:hypothetical protein [Gemmatimonadota bacterium]
MLRSLAALLEWLGARTPPGRLDQIVTQDEFTHDVVVADTDGRWLVFDVT